MLHKKVHFKQIDTESEYHSNPRGLWRIARRLSPESRLHMPMRTPI
jgi:hypothetical protein